MVLEADQRGGEAHGDQKELEAGVHLCAGINILKQNEMITLKKLRQIEQRLISSKPLRVSSYTFFIEGFKTQKSEAFYIHTGLTPPQPIFWKVNTRPCFRTFKKKIFFFSLFLKAFLRKRKEGSRKR